MNHATEGPPAIVAQAESATELPGLKRLISEMALNAKLIWEQHNQNRLSRLEIARALNAYAERPEVQAEVRRLEAARKLQPGYQGGRPFSAKTIAARELCNAAKIPIRTITRWLADWSEIAELLGLPEYVETEVDRLMASWLLTHPTGTFDGWIEYLVAQGHAKNAGENKGNDTAPDPEQIAASIERIFLKYFTDKNGHVRLDRKGTLAVVKKVNPIMHNLGFELCPLGRD